MYLKYGNESYYDGDVIEVKDKNGKSEFLPEGKGTFISINGEKYVGEWKGGKRNGKGKYFFTSGNIYEGDFTANAMTGNG